MYHRDGAIWYVLQEDADVIHTILNTDGLANLRLLAHLPLDKEYLWTLVSHASNVTNYFHAATHFGCLPTAINVSSVYRHCKVKPGIIAPASVQIENILSQKLHCDLTAPLITLGAGLYAQFHLSEAIFMRSTFWALPLLSNATATEWDYVVQYLMWQIGQGLTLYLPRSYQQYISTLSSSHQVISSLSQAHCASTAYIDDCINILLRRLWLAKLISGRLLKTMTTWLSDLKEIGYSFPSVRKQLDMNCSIPVMWSPIPASATSNKQYVSVANVAQSAELRKQLCQTLNTTLNQTNFKVSVNLTHSWHQFRRLLLVITFNKAHYEVIPYLELLYRSMFPHILYCGPSPFDIALNEYKVSFITYTEWPVHRSPGSVSYQCAIQAVRMNFPVDGFLFVSDDVLILPVPLSKLSGDRVWFTPTNEIRIGDLDSLRECHLGMCDFHPHWDWWTDYKSATIEALDRMSQLSRFSPLVYHCLAKLRQLNGVGQSHTRVNGAYSDIFHIPLRIAHNFADVAEIFADSGVFLEIAVPTVLQCIDRPEKFQPLPGKDIEVQTTF